MSRNFYIMYNNIIAAYYKRKWFFNEKINRYDVIFKQATFYIHFIYISHR